MDRKLRVAKRLFESITGAKKSTKRSISDSDIEAIAEMVMQKKSENEKEVVGEETEDTGVDDVTKLRQELDDVKSVLNKMSKNKDLKLVEKMIKMVTELIKVENPSKRKSSKGLQLKRKDRDLMDDTGGGSYKKNDPQIKPPRDDMKKPFNKKKTKPCNRDKDTDNDPDMKKGE